MLGMIGEWLGIITGVVCGASIICALTPTPKDDQMIAKLYVNTKKNDRLATDSRHIKLPVSTIHFLVLKIRSSGP